MIKHSKETQTFKQNISTLKKTFFSEVLNLQKKCQCLDVKNSLQLFARKWLEFYIKL